MLTLSRTLRVGLRLTLALGSAAIAFPAEAQTTSGTQSVSPVKSLTGAQPGIVADSGTQTLTVPFGVGERMEYEVRFLGGKKGIGVMEVKEITNVRGRPAWHTVFNVDGRVWGLISVDITLESWFDVATITSLRYHSDQRYARTKKIQTFEIFPERGMYREDKLDERVTVSNPLDDGSFLYFVRSIPLEVGKTYSFDRYFKPDKNPVKIVVVRREKVKTPAGEFNALVLRPEINSNGLFAKGKSEVWITDDAARMVVKLQSELPVGTLSLWLMKHQAGTPHKP